MHLPWKAKDGGVKDANEGYTWKEGETSQSRKLDTSVKPRGDKSMVSSYPDHD